MLLAGGICYLRPSDGHDQRGQRDGKEKPPHSLSLHPDCSSSISVGKHGHMISHLGCITFEGDLHPRLSVPPGARDLPLFVQLPAGTELPFSHCHLTIRPGAKPHGVAVEPMRKLTLGACQRPNRWQKPNGEGKPGPCNTALILGTTAPSKYMLPGRILPPNLELDHLVGGATRRVSRGPPNPLRSKYKLCFLVELVGRRRVVVACSAGAPVKWGVSFNQSQSLHCSEMPLL